MWWEKFQYSIMDATSMDDASPKDTPEVGQRWVSAIDTVEILEVSPPIAYDGRQDYAVRFRVVDVHVREESSLEYDNVELLFSDLLRNYYREREVEEALDQPITTRQIRAACKLALQLRETGKGPGETPFIAAINACQQAGIPEEMSLLIELALRADRPDDFQGWADGWADGNHVFDDQLPEHYYDLPDDYFNTDEDRQRYRELRAGHLEYLEAQKNKPPT